MTTNFELIERKPSDCGEFENQYEFKFNIQLDEHTDAF